MNKIHIIGISAKKRVPKAFFNIYIYNLQTSPHRQHVSTSMWRVPIRLIQSDCIVVALRAGIFLLTALFNFLFFLYKYRPSIEIPITVSACMFCWLDKWKIYSCDRVFFFSRKKHKNRNTKEHRKSIACTALPTYIYKHIRTQYGNTNISFFSSAFVCVCACCLCLRVYTFVLSTSLYNMDSNGVSIGLKQSEPRLFCMLCMHTFAIFAWAKGAVSLSFSPSRLHCIFSSSLILYAFRLFSFHIEYSRSLAASSVGTACK